MAVSKYLQKAQGNSSSTTVSSAVSDSATSMPLTSDTAFAGEGMVIVDEGQSTEELAYATGKVGSALTTLVADRGLEGGSPQAHGSTATVKGILTAGMWNNVITSLSLLINSVTGAIKTVIDMTGVTLTAPTLTTPQINDTSSDHQYIVAPSELSADRTITLPLLTGNDEMMFKSHHIESYNINSLSRQAIINGNFDVWQRGVTSGTLPDAVFTWTADRWRDYHADDGGTLPTLTRTREILTTGDIANAFYYSRLTTNGAGTSLGNNSVGQYGITVENGVRLLAGLNKEVTLSFWAKSDIANKKLGIRMLQDYGTAGSPTTQEIVNGTNWTLTSTWTKYTHTFTTNTLSGKTFGTSNNDYLAVYFTYMWGSTRQAQYDASAAETYVGSGNIDIAQVQLCAGDVALPFQPKSYQQEIDDCYRYCFSPVCAETIAWVGFGHALSTTRADCQVLFPKPMRTQPTLTATAADWAVEASDGTQIAITAISMGTTRSNNRCASMECTVASGLTAAVAYKLSADGTANRVMIFSAEL